MTHAVVARRSPQVAGAVNAVDIAEFRQHPGDRRPARADAGPVEDVFQVLTNGAHRREQPGGDLGVAQALRRQFEPLPFARSQDPASPPDRAGVYLRHMRAKQCQQILLPVGEVGACVPPEQQIPFASGGRRQPDRQQVLDAARLEGFPIQRLLGEQPAWVPVRPAANLPGP